MHPIVAFIFVFLWALGLICFVVDPQAWVMSWGGYTSVICAYLLTIGTLSVKR